MKKLALLFGLFTSAMASAQEVKVLSFSEVYKLLHVRSDTVYVINFWATWCKPCVQELPHLEKLQKELGPKVRVILVSIDFKSQLESRLIPFIKEQNIQSEVILLDAPNANQWIDKVDPSWSGTIPATVIHGKKFWKFYEKEFTYEELRKIVDPLIKN